MSAEGKAVVTGVRILHAETAEQIAAVRELLKEYWRKRELSPCFFEFDKELEGLPGDYAPPEGRLLVAECDGQVIGCVALHKIEPGICEMKRLYLRSVYRKKGIGRMLAEGIIAEARGIGYERMRLDTIEPMMQDAVALYRKLGFYEIGPYRRNPLAGVMFMELKF